MRLNKDLQQYLDDAKPLSGDNIVTVTDLKTEVIQFLTSYDQYSGYKSISFDFFNQKLKGLRMGEFSILTGETGSGKTTFLTQLSLDFLQQRVPTLWGSFEIKNDKLISLFLMQLAKKNLRQAPVNEIEYYAEILEKFPLYLLKFHGSQNIEEIMNTMNYAVYNFDIQNIVLDNLQFMVGVPSTVTNKNMNKFDYQDEIIQRMRKFATEKNIHLTLVIHPKKTDEALKISSIFGTAKASQEADNIYIIQAYKGIRIMEIAKNRFDGSTGKSAIAFDTDSCRYFELEENEFTDYTKGVKSIQDIISERINLHGKVEFKAKEYVGVNYDKIVEFNNNLNTKHLQEKLEEMIHMSETLLQEKNNSFDINKLELEVNFNVESIVENDNSNFDTVVFNDDNFNDFNDFNVRGNSNKEVSIKENIENQEIKLTDEKQIKTNHIINNNLNEDCILKNDFIANKENEINDKEKINNAETNIIEEVIPKMKKAASKKNDILPEGKNPITQKLKEKKRISKSAKKLSDIELKENSTDIIKIKNEINVENFNDNANNQANLIIGHNLIDPYKEEPVIVNKDLLFDETGFFKDVNDSIKTMIKEENYILEEKNKINSNLKVEGLKEDSEEIRNLKPKIENKKVKKDAQKNDKHEDNCKTDIIQVKEESLINKEEISKAKQNIKTEEDNSDVKNIYQFALTEEEKLKVFNNEIYDKEIEKETIKNINIEQGSIFPEICYVENFHNPTTQEKAISFDVRNRRKNYDLNRNNMFAPLKYTK